MKKTILTLLTLFILIIIFVRPVHAISDAESIAIQNLLDDASRKSGVPGMSISIISEEETFYFSSGFADREKGLPATEDSLYELASVSKAFTGFGILLLEEHGLLSMKDPVHKYLPWFTVNYKGMPVDMENLTLNHFLYHTSGLTNGQHFQSIPQGSTQDMLRKTVEILVEAELAFYPGERYEYGTVNYDVLGLVIEVVTGQSYESFMTEEVFIPLGLDHTYVYKEDALATGQLAQGYRSSFFITSPYDAPDYAGNKPAGYIISSTRDMARWMKIQMGLVDDIPEGFKAVVEKSHKGNTFVPEVNGMLYAAGWEVNIDQTIIEHSGGNPNFSTQVTIFPSEGTAICLLTNGANTNLALANSLKDILDGKLAQSYKISSTQLLDIVLSTVTVIASLLAIVFVFRGLGRRRVKKQSTISKRKRFNRVVWFIITFALFILCWTYPMLIGYDWPTFLVWQTYSFLTALISLTLLSASITYFTYRA